MEMKFLVKIHCDVIYDIFSESWLHISPIIPKIGKTHFLERKVVLLANNFVDIRFWRIQNKGRKKETQLIFLLDYKGFGVDLNKYGKIHDSKTLLGSFRNCE
jgi:hypothetical protein